MALYKVTLLADEREGLEAITHKGSRHYHVNDAKRLLTILSVATREDVYEELRMRLGKV